MHQKMTALVLGVILLSGFIQFASADSCQGSDGKTYESSKYKFSIWQPANWERQAEYQADYGPSGITFLEASTMDKVQATSVIISAEDMQGLTFQQYIKASIHTLQTGFDSGNFTITSQGATTVDGKEAYYIIWTLDVGIVGEVKQIIIHDGDRAVIITYGGLQESYEKYLDQFSQILTTFKFLD